MGKIQNIGFVAHVDAGKTTTTEQVLYVSGKVRKLGNVDKGSSHMDWSPIEKERGITIFADQAVVDWKGEIINLIDTPGHVDFSTELERAVKVLDGAVLIISAVEGIQAHTETIWHMLRKYHIPTLIFINKMDRIGVDLDRLLHDIRMNLTDRIVLMHKTNKVEKDFNGFIDVLEQKQYVWNNENIQKPEVIKQESEQEKVVLIEKTAEVDEAILEKYLSEIEISDRELLDAIARQTKTCQLYPVCFGSSMKGIGITNLLDAIIRFLPNSAGDPKQDLSGVIYKVKINEDMGKLTYVKVTNGILKVRDTVHIHGQEEKVTSILKYTGEKFEQIDELRAGDIGVLAGLTSGRVGDCLGAYTIQENKNFIVSVLRSKIIPETEENVSELLKVMKILNQEDPSLNFSWDSDKKEMHIDVMGTIHMEILQQTLKERFGQNINLGQPSVNYAETVTKVSRGFCHFEPKKHYAEVEVEIEPGRRGQGVQYKSCLSTDILPTQYQNIIEKTVDEAVKHGVLTGSPVSDIKIKLINGKHHLKHTHGGDFRIAFIRALQQALQQNECILLEPLYQYKIVVHKDLAGRIMSDILKMNGSFDEPVVLEENVVITGEVPIATSMHYSVELASMTSGKAMIAMNFSRYERCHNQETVLADQINKVEKDETLYNAVSLFREKRKMKKVK